jgi:hypothetical protein
MPTPYKIQNKLMDSDGAAFQPLYSTSRFCILVLASSQISLLLGALTTSPSLQRPMGSPLLCKAPGLFSAYLKDVDRFIKLSHLNCRQQQLYLLFA